MGAATVKPLLSDEHSSGDGTLLQACAFRAFLKRIKPSNNRPAQPSGDLSDLSICIDGADQLNGVVLEHVPSEEAPPVMQKPLGGNRGNGFADAKGRLQEVGMILKVK